ncbi:Conserved hypothetical protein [gamma proteobacterium HdN1]|nr:Conserved hypothetical protein [gamma proteobacterium HdN1]
MRFKQEPEDILKGLGIYHANDIDLDLIAYSLNAEVKRNALSDCEGHIIGTDTNAIITINSNAPTERQRFSLGHELGHWVNDRNKNLTYRCNVNDMRQRSPAKDNFRQQKEVRANQFSAQLIMPKHIIAPQLNSMAVTFDNVRLIANDFRVSRTSAAIRIVELSPYPCMLICWSKQGTRRWFARSPLVPDNIWPHRTILNPHINFQASNAIEVDADMWIDDIAASDFTLIQSVFSNSYDIFSLLWWKNEGQLIALQNVHSSE